MAFVLRHPDGPLLWVFSNIIGMRSSAASHGHRRRKVIDFLGASSSSASAGCFSYSSFAFCLHEGLFPRRCFGTHMAAIARGCAG